MTRVGIEIRPPSCNKGPSPAEPRPYGIWIEQVHFEPIHEVMASWLGTRDILDRDQSTIRVDLDDNEVSCGAPVVEIALLDPQQRGL